MKLDRYVSMRDFSETTEPPGRVAPSGGHSFVVQKHDATRLHYDFRLEHDGVMWSWAVPKGPSLNPQDKRLAVQTEDHPLDYRDFEGTIPEGQYGGGTVIVWDRGTWTPIDDPDTMMKKGKIELELEGEKLHGRFVLVRTAKDKKTWLLIKKNDAHVKKIDLVAKMPKSVISGRTIEDIDAGLEADPMPAFGSITPQLATLVKGVPTTTAPWIYEIKYDGYRTMGWLEDGKVRLASRRGLDWTSKYEAIADALSRVRAKTAIFDGEVAWVDEDGRTSFQKLQNALKSPRARDRLVYFIFDLLYFDGVDLRDKPLQVRKDKLRTILAGEDAPLKMSDDVSDGHAFFREACKLGLEGIIGKRADRPYVSTRSKDWVKVKCHLRQEVVVVGFTAPKGHRQKLGALLVGTHDEHGNLRYAGKVGTGFTNATLEDLAQRLTPLAIDTSPLVNPPRKKDVTWVKPKHVAEVRFTEWTTDGVMRHPSFEGLRLDKTAKEVHREVAKEIGIKVSHPERVIAKGFTKLDLVQYAANIAETMLPFVLKRPLMLRRYPSGIDKPGFVQKHRGQGLSADAIGMTLIENEDALFIRKADDIVTLAQNNAVEIHGWGSTLPRWNRPDWIVMDLDPDEALAFKVVVDAAFEIREALRTLGLESWVKTTGGKGLHVVVPLARRYDWPTVRAVSEHIAVLMAEAAPKRYVATMSKKRRIGRIFLDYLRNAEGATAVLPYSARSRPGLTVALPVEWTDLRSVDPRELTIATVPHLVSTRKKDPWADLLETKQTLPRELLKAARQ